MPWQLDSILRTVAFNIAPYCVLLLMQEIAGAAVSALPILFIYCTCGRGAKAFCKGGRSLLELPGFENKKLTDTDVDLCGGIINHEL